MDHTKSFLEGKKSFLVLFRELGFLGFVLLLVKSDKLLLIKRLRYGVYARAYGIYKKYRNLVLVPYLIIADFTDIHIYRRELIPLHLKLKANLKAQKGAWKSHIYAGGYYYQGWLDIGIRGFRETNERLENYDIDEYLTPEKNVLDIGCNCGFLALKVAQSTRWVDAVELNPFLVALGKEAQKFLKINNVSFIVGDFSELEFRKGYDVIFSLANHKTGDGNLTLSFRDYMEKIYSLLKDDGYIIFESHVPEADDPGFRKQIESVLDLFSIKCEKRFSQYKIVYIGDRLLFVLKKRNVQIANTVKKTQADTLLRFKKWHEVWERKGKEIVGLKLMDLITANGFDNGAAKMTESLWLGLVDQIKSEMKLDKADSLLEVGCGSGALLLPLSQLPIKLAGIDYSAPLIDFANKAVKGLDARVSEAASIPFPKNSFSRVLSHGIFHYFPNENYACKVLKEMLRVLAKGGCLLIVAIPDMAKKDDCENLRRSMVESEGKNYLTSAKSGYEHLYYSKRFFYNFFENNGLNSKVVDHCLDGYGNAPFQFNVSVWK